MADDALRLAKNAVTLAQGAFADVIGGTDITNQTIQVKAQLEQAQTQLTIAARDKVDMSAELEKARADLKAANEQLAQTGRQVNGQPLPPGTYVSAKAALGMTLLGAVLGAGGGVAAVKIIDKQKEKKLANGNGQTALAGAKEKSA